MARVQSLWTCWMRMVEEKTSVPPEKCSVKMEADDCISNTFRTVKVCWSSSVSVVRIDISNVSMITESLKFEMK